MRFPVGLQLLSCLMVCSSSAHAIMVKYGTSGGPIVPPTPAPTLPPQQPFRVPAPVWEQRSDDSPDPNAQWRPQLFIPQPRYTQVVFNPQEVPTAIPQNNAQRFVNAYLPRQPTVPQPIQAQPVKEYFTPAQVLSSQTLPGFGLRYFLPLYAKDAPQVQQKEDDAKYNHIESNDVDGTNKDEQSDLQWKYEKDVTNRIARSTADSTGVPTQSWSIYVPPQSRHHYNH